jgi:hypothetical protein
VRFEQQDLTECLFEVTAEADGAIVDKDVCAGFLRMVAAGSPDQTSGLAAPY